MSSTKVFKLVSGVECEIKPLTGFALNELTKANGKSGIDKLCELAASSVTRIGLRTDIEHRDVMSLLDCDQKKLLMEVGLFSDPDSETKKMRKGTELFDLTDRSIFDEQPYKDVDKEGRYHDVHYTELSEIKKTRKCTLLDRKDKAGNGIEVEFKLLDSNMMKAIEKTQEEKRDIALLFTVQQVTEFIDNPTGKAKIQTLLPFIILSARDVKIISKAMNECKGNYNTEFDIQNPNGANYAPIKANLLFTQGFIVPQI